MNPFRTILFLLFLFCMVAYTSCDKKKSFKSENGPSHVEIRKIGEKYQLYVNDEPYFVKGVGLDFNAGHDFKALQDAGGNTFRTWRTTNADQELDSARKYGLMVAMGIDLEKELHGFDYNNTEAVAKQLEEVKKQVLKYKGHPNLLCWVAGNELNLLLDEKGQMLTVNPKVYDALADIVDFIHQEDPHHPVTFTFAGVHPTHIETALERCPNIDALSFQVYGGLGALPQQIRNLKLSKPYFITEYGPSGHWEVPSTEWGREIEEPSAIKAEGFRNRIEKGIKTDSSGLCIGNFAFIWGQKQERTPTWYGMFLKSGEATAVVDELFYFWNGKYPANRAPMVGSITLNGQLAVQNIYLAPSETCNAELSSSDPDNDSLVYEWTILKEVMERSQGGAFEQEPESVPIDIKEANSNLLTFIAPKEEGDYRLFGYVYDNKGKVGYANIPFYIKKQ